ncbi:MAG TPA: PHB depolymerase family esterase [Polyangiales bacterium]|nr:PHB depolymerase family esterase [Polyangiales bacterium]
MGGGSGINGGGSGVGASGTGVGTGSAGFDSNTGNAGNTGVAGDGSQSGGAGAGTSGSGGVGGDGSAGSAGDGGGGAGGMSAPITCSGTLAVPAGNTTKTMMWAGAQREYIVHVPASVDGKKAVPLVIDIHGLTSSDTAQAGLSGWREKSDKEGFIVVHPQGLGNSWNGGSLCCGSSLSGKVDDEGFMREIVKQMEKDACIDPKRVYATGLSNGGAMSHLLACRAADVFAATAPISMGNGTMPCQPTRPISVIMFRGTADTLVPYNGGTFPSAMADFDQWKMLSSCTGTPTTTHGVCQTYTQCKDNVEVTLCTIQNGMHVIYSQAASAGAPVPDVVWEAFQRQTLP